MMLPKFSFSWGLVLWFTGFKRPLWIAVIGCRPLRVPHDVKKNLFIFFLKSPKMRMAFLVFVFYCQKSANAEHKLLADTAALSA